MKVSISPQPFVPAMPVIIVAARDGEKINFAPHGMFGQLSYEPPLMYISVIKEHLTAKIINKTQKFSINIANTELLDKIKYCGSISGAERDKSKEFDIFYGKNGTPMILKCPVNMNCEVYQTIDTKDMFVFIGRITEMFTDEECLINNEIIAENVDPIVCTIQGQFHKMGNKIE